MSEGVADFLEAQNMGVCGRGSAAKRKIRIRKRTCSVALAYGLFCAGAIQAQAVPDVLYGVDATSSFGGPSALITVDTTTGAGAAIGPTGFVTVEGLAIAADGRIFGISNPFLGGSGDLIEIDPTTGAGIIVGPVVDSGGTQFLDLSGLTFAPDGTLFGAADFNLGTAARLLVRIDPLTGVATVIGSIGFPVEALTFASDGTLFGMADTLNSPDFQAETLVTINVTTGAETIVGLVGFNDIDGLAFLNGTLFAVAHDAVNATLISIDPTTGAGTSVGLVGSAFVGGLASLEPGALEVEIDIKPGSDPNSINLSSAGVVPVAILSEPTFDAPVEVDPDTIALAGARVRLVGKSNKLLCHAQDVNADGLVDLVCLVETAQFIVEEGESIAVLEAETFGGAPVRGEDSIRIVPDN